jgi:excisionase family DNA binding protein
MSTVVAEGSGPGIAQRRTPMVTPREIAEAVGVSSVTVVGWAKSGRFKAIRIGRVTRFPRSVLDDLLACRVNA